MEKKGDRTTGASADMPRARAQALENFRARAGYSMDDLAKAMGFSGQSSIQRYLSPDYEKRFRPELIERFERALVGKGKPPIQDYELAVLWTGKFDSEPESPLGLRNTLGTFDSTLDLPEGKATFQIPWGLSPKSVTLVRMWADRVLDAAESEATKASSHKKK